MEIKINSLNDIDSAAKEFLAAVAGKRHFAFYGPMGAGKTTFIKAVCEQLGTTDTVSSPSFAIINEYNSAAGRIFHFDFYRIKNLEDTVVVHLLYSSFITSFDVIMNLGLFS